ncbi:MAG: SEC-C metal-binding domain-containing protein [Dehalococcoidia bacterium]
MDLLTGAAGGSCPVTGARNLADASVPAVAQNHACPCGSGKKYKRCHGLAR